MDPCSRTNGIIRYNRDSKSWSSAGGSSKRGKTNYALSQKLPFGGEPESRVDRIVRIAAMAEVVVVELAVTKAIVVCQLGHQTYLPPDQPTSYS